MAMLTRLCAISFILSYVTGDFHDWIDPIHVEELQTAYYDIFDHNNDGIVNINEIRLGILAQLQSNIELIDSDAVSFIPIQFSCNPSLDFVDFADCISIAARLLFKNNDDKLLDIIPKDIQFDSIYNKYLGQCTDESPIQETYCYEMVQESPEKCMIWSRTNQPYCKLSCFNCNDESYIFTDKYPVRGLNGKYIPRPERLSTYDMPQHITSDAANCSAVAPTNHSGQILFVSDIHVEPWYNVDGTGGVSRFSGATISNMWQCRDNAGHQVACTLDGHSDPPFPLFKTGMDFLAKHALPSDLSKDILIMPGDTQAHSYNSHTPPETETIPPLMNKVINEMLTYFKSKNIFYAAGNNDGQHDIIFCSGSDPAINTAWSTPFITDKIVNNDLNRVYVYKNKTYDAVNLFNNTGYYVKQIPAIFSNSSHNENFYAIILNTNLGSSNGLQNFIFNQDLEWIKKQNNGHLIVIGHHPNIVTTIIPSKYQSIVVGSFSGHVHFFQPSDNKYFAIIPAVIQDAAYVAVMTGDLNKNGDIVLTWNNFNQYLGAAHTLPQEDCWGYKGKPK